MIVRRRSRVRRLHVWELPQAQALARRTWEEELFRDIGRRVPFPPRPLILYRSYLDSDPGGCLVKTEGGEMIAAAYAHTWGSTGWIGPVEVDPEHQHCGHGSEMVRACLHYLRRSGCRHIGLEANGDSPASLSFYRRLGFREVAPAPFFEKDLGGGNAKSESHSLVDLDQLSDQSLELRGLLDRVSPGLDLDNELWMAVRDLGAVLQVGDRQGRIKGLAIIHRPLVPELNGNPLRCLLTDPEDERSFAVMDRLLAQCEQLSSFWGSGRLFFSSPVDPSTLQVLSHRGYRMMGHNVRLAWGEVMPLRGRHHILSWSG